MRLWTFKELLTPAYWRYRKATRLVDHARLYLYSRRPDANAWAAMGILLDAHW